MNAEAGYTIHHPHWYRRRVSVWWWLGKPAYARFVLRELTSVAVAFFAVVLLWKMRAFRTGPEAYAEFLTRMKSPLFLALNGVAFLLVLFHTVTWFNLAPKAMVVRLGGKRLPDWIIQAGNYVAWLVLSAGLAWLVLRG
jgi:fumarate reductase subunit C